MHVRGRRVVLAGLPGIVESVTFSTTQRHCTDHRAEGTGQRGVPPAAR
ncbi:hypothetical protein Pd630_LPD04657 [Rhodococcus opacus PD630]|nr:hypothetical protein Pd630_LPD04657 [Rhodococcus opacus PD630]